MFECYAIVVNNYYVNTRRKEHLLKYKNTCTQLGIESLDARLFIFISSLYDRAT